jgi:D-ribose pyranose/furanose isomerase RbsD
VKKGRILNQKLNEALASMGHGDWILITDAGFPIPNDSRRIDLALEANVPTVAQVLSAILSDFVYERCVVTLEQKTNHPRLYSEISALIDRCTIETLPYPQFMSEYAVKPKFFVRSGAFEPWGNIALCSGVDASRWFLKEKGIIVPEYYVDRVNYRGKP